MKPRATWVITRNALGRAGVSPRIWVVFALGAVLALYSESALVSRARADGTTINALEGYINMMSWRSGSSILLCLTAFMFCDAPFIDGDTYYAVYRSGRASWMAGQLAYIGALVCLFHLVMGLCVTLYILPYAYVGGQYSQTLYVMVVDGSSLVSYAMMRALSPLAAAIYCFLLNLLFCMVVGIVLFIVNLRYKRIYGFCAVGFLLIWGIFCEVLALPAYLSPVHLAMPRSYGYGQALPTLSIPLQGVAVFATLLVVLISICSHLVKRKGFSFGE